MIRANSSLLGIGLAACLPALAHAQASVMSSYDITHNFTWNPPAGANGLPLVTGFGFQHAWVRDGRGPWWGADVSPMVQDPGFDMFGTDAGAGLGSVNSGIFAPVPCHYGVFNIPDTGHHSFGCLTVTSPNGGGSASACLGFDVGPYAIGSPVVGQIRSAGGVIATGPWAESYAYSSAGITIHARNAQGQILWTPFMDGVSGSAHAVSLRRDPIVLTVFGGGGNSASATLLDIEYRTYDADQFRWANDQWSTDGREVEFWISIPPHAARNPGELRIQIRNGVLVTAHSSGSLSVPLPPVGASVPISFPLPNAMPIDYDGTVLLPNERIGRATLDMLGGGDAPADIGCSLDFNSDGTVDFFDYDDFVLCFATGICPDGRSADYNQDDSIDFFDYDDFVQDFELGC